MTNAASADDSSVAGVPVRPWPAGSSTGVGSLPGEDPVAAVAWVFDAAPELPHLPELPGRGAGADVVGRTASLLTDIHLDLQPSGWRVVGRPGVDERRAADFLARDLDALEAAADGFTGALKVQVAGPLTLAASLELSKGGAALADHGAVRDIAEALADGVEGHLRDLARRVPGARLVLQIDEPSLPAVLSGEVPSASGFGTIRPVEEPVALDRLRAVTGAVESAAAVPILHCCAPRAPVALATRAGARAVALDLSLIAQDRAVLDALAAAIDEDTAVLLGVVPALDPPVTERSVRFQSDRVRRLWRQLGFRLEELPQRVVITPSCGLAGASPDWARAAYRLCRQVATALTEGAEEGPVG